MSDPITCPECEGRGEQRIGPLRLQCPLCSGAGQVGGDDGPRYNAQGWKIPEEGEEYDPEVHGPLPGTADSPAVRDSGLCPVCLGAKVVVAPGTYVEAPCPRCSKPEDISGSESV